IAKPPRHCARTHPELARDLRDRRFAMWKELRYGFLHLRTKTRALWRVPGERLFRVSPQQFVQVKVAPDRRERGHSRRKTDLICISAKFNVSPKEAFQFRLGKRTEVPHFQLARHEPAVCDLPTDAHQRNQPELHVMTIRPTICVYVFETDGRALSQAEMQANA